MDQIPKVNVLESVKGLMFHGYDFISEKSREVASDVFETDVLFNKFILCAARKLPGFFTTTENST